MYCVISNSVFHGGTLAHDKLCCLHIHPKAKYIFQMCNFSHKFVDEPEESYELQDMHVMKGLLHAENL